MKDTKLKRIIENEEVKRLMRLAFDVGVIEGVNFATEGREEKIRLPGEERLESGYQKFLSQMDELF